MKNLILLGLIALAIFFTSCSDSGTNPNVDDNTLTINIDNKTYGVKDRILYAVTYREPFLNNFNRRIKIDTFYAKAGEIKQFYIKNLQINDDVSLYHSYYTNTNIDLGNFINLYSFTRKGQVENIKL